MPFFVIDQIPPELEWVYPNGGEQFNPLDEITTQWTAIDSSWDATDITFYLSSISGDSFDEVAVNIENTGFHVMTLPDINTESAQFKIYAIDAYGNDSEDLADGTFSIGVLEDDFSDTTAVSISTTDIFTIDHP